MRIIERGLLLLLTLSALVALYAGWRLTWFITDDAYITFRYAVNSMKGFGYVWNSPPFLPVEGYTSFLWLLLLDGVWRVFGIAPPESSTDMGFGFTAVTLLLGIVMVWRLQWHPPFRPFRLLFVLIFLGGVVGNRTFLTWGSSGLETGLFNFTLTLWLFVAIFVSHRYAYWVLFLTTAAALSALTRPDGLLLVASSIVMVAIVAFERYRQKMPIRWFILAASPLLLIPCHLLWRYSFYGEWLPNTYYAKVTNNDLVLESGSRYLLSFIMEYFLWSWFIIGGLLLWQVMSRRTRSSVPVLNGKTLTTPLLLKIGAVGTIGFHTFYYTFIVGGDHFEFRVYSHLILVLFILLIWMFNQIRAPLPHTLTAFVVIAALTFPLQWYHWFLSDRYITRDETFMLRVPVAEIARVEQPWLPQPILEYMALYDGHQKWLIEHFIGVRQREHEILVAATLPNWPATPFDVPNIIDGNIKVIAHTGVGMLGYQWSDVAIIDVYGLNDYVVARNPDLRYGGLMAHERQPPVGYLECFLSTRDQIESIPVEQVIECENRFRTIIQAMERQNP